MQGSAVNDVAFELMLAFCMDRERACCLMARVAAAFEMATLVLRRLCGSQRADQAQPPQPSPHRVLEAGQQLCQGTLPCCSSRLTMHTWLDSCSGQPTHLPWQQIWCRSVWYQACTLYTCSSMLLMCCHRPDTAGSSTRATLCQLGAPAMDCACRPWNLTPNPGPDAEC